MELENITFSYALKRNHTMNEDREKDIHKYIYAEGLGSIHPELRHPKLIRK